MMNDYRLKILVIDDDKQIRQVLKSILGAKEYRVFLAASGEEGLRLAVDEQPELIILDLVMPGIDGLAVCKSLRTWYRAPIIVLSVLDREADKIKALNLGADDYMTKPFSIGELLARIEAHRRRIQTVDVVSSIFTVGALEVDVTKRRIRLNSRVLKLTPIEYQILVLLARNPDCVVTTRMIKSQLWGDFSDTVNLRMHVSRLRKKLSPTPESPQYIRTEPRIGFRLIADEMQED